MAGNGNRHTPPGEGCVHSCRQNPGTEQIPGFSWFIVSLLGSEEAGNSGKVDPAESQCQDRSPAEAGEGQVTKYIIQGELGGAVVEHFECEQRADDDNAPDQAAFYSQSLEH